MPELPQRYMSVDEVADLFNIPKATLYALNTKGTGSRFVKIGRHCRYDPQDVREWLEAKLQPASATKRQVVA